MFKQLQTESLKYQRTELENPCGSSLHSLDPSQGLTTIGIGIFADLLNDAPAACAYWLPGLMSRKRKSTVLETYNSRM